MDADHVGPADPQEATPTGDGRVRKTMKKAAAFAQQKSEEAHLLADWASTAFEDATVRSVNAAAALRRLAQDAIVQDTGAAFDCVGKIADARSGLEVVSAQVNYARARTRTCVERWASVAQILARAGQAATRVVETSVLQRAR